MATAVLTQELTVSQKFENSLFELEDGENVQTCIQCGACAGICPLGPWMDYAPRRMIAYMRENMFDQVIASETAWMCVSCYACANGCPQEIPLTAALMTRAKEEMVLAGDVPAELQAAFEHTQRYGNPLGESPRRRARWTKKLEPPVPVLGKEKQKTDVLWFVGDYASYHPRVRLTTIALAMILQKLDVDFAILGRDEVSDGDSQRLAGENGLFEMLAEKNGRALSKYQFNEIITTDPHAYNALKNEYPRLGIQYPIKHYTQFLAERLDQIEPLLKQEIRAFVAYHDPCYLGRVNGVYDEPRDLLEAIPGVVLVEMSHNRSTSLCCGGGGGMWLDGFHWEKTGNRMSEWRVKEALHAAPEEQVVTVFSTERKPKRGSQKSEDPTTRILAVACPYETPRFEDAVKVIPEASELLVKDIAELLVEAMEI